MLDTEKPKTKAMKGKTRTRQLADAEFDLHAEGLRASPSLTPYYQREVERLSRPEHPPEICSGEVLPSATENYIIRDRLQDPDTVAVDASLYRTDMLQRAGCLETGLDAAATIQARNSLEKMLSHQLAACHAAAMRLLADVYEKPVNGYTVAAAQYAEQVGLKKIGAAARLMDTFQKGMDTLTRTRTAGRQTITVKQVHVSGGQAVIADTVHGVARNSEDTPVSPRPPVNIDDL